MKRSVCMCFFSLLFFSPLAISGAALQEEKLVGICASLLPSPGGHQYAGPVTWVKAHRCLCTVKVTAGAPFCRGRSSSGAGSSRDAWAGCAAPEEDEDEDEDGFLFG